MTAVSMKVPAVSAASSSFHCWIGMLPIVSPVRPFTVMKCSMPPLAPGWWQEDSHTGSYVATLRVPCSLRHSSCGSCRCSARSCPLANYSQGL